MRKPSTQPMVRARSLFRLSSKLARNCLSEFIGTMMLLFLGCAICLQYTLSDGKLSSWLHVNIGWGFALTLSALATYQTSGGQLNPAISLLMATLGNMPYSWVLPYSIAQLSGAFTGAALAYGVYYERSLRYLAALPSPGHLTACFTSWPSNASHTTAFIDQVAGTAVLAFFICVCVDRRNKVPVFLQPLFFGFLLIMIGCALNLNVGYPINPARDLGPRIFAFLLFGMEVFSHSNYYFWIPVVAPFFGALIGGWLYQILIGVQIDKDPEEEYELKQAV
ncbi:unnamed protein product, partial [Mesorhabditis spiculigera]